MPNTGITSNQSSYLALSDNSVVYTNGATWNCWVDYTRAQEFSTLQSMFTLSLGLRCTSDLELDYILFNISVWSFSLDGLPQFRLGWSLTSESLISSPSETSQQLYFWSFNFISFNLGPLSSNTAITLARTGYSHFSGASLVVSSGSGSLGNAFYNIPFTFYQNGIHLSFTAFFTFKITNCGAGSCADGFTFIVKFREFFYFWLDLQKSIFFLFSMF